MANWRVGRLLVSDWIMADSPPGKPPPNPPFSNENLEGITGVGATDRLMRLRRALESVQKRAHALSEEITLEMDRLGLPLPPDKTKP